LPTSAAKKVKVKLQETDNDRKNQSGWGRRMMDSTRNPFWGTAGLPACSIRQLGRMHECPIHGGYQFQRGGKLAANTGLVACRSPSMTTRDTKGSYRLRERGRRYQFRSETAKHFKQVGTAKIK